MPAIPVTPEPSRARRLRRSRLRLIGAAAAVVVGVVAGAVMLSREATPTRQDLVAARGAEVMPFDLEATTHIFDATRVGGVQRVIADDPGDAQEVELIRGHLRAEIARFRVGDFGDPATIHGHDMPGLAVLEASRDELEISFRDVAAGAEVTYRSTDPAVVAALHEWFAAQLADHGSHAHAG